MAKFCEGCGHPLEEDACFCNICGRAVQQQPPVYPPQQPYYPPQAPSRPYAAVGAAYPPAQKKKPGTGLIVGLILGGAAIVAAAVMGVALLGRGGSQKVVAGPTATAKASGLQLILFPDALKADSKNVTVHCTYTPPATIIPANYRSMDSVITLKCSTDSGTTRLLVTVEIPEFTQKYQQMIDVSRAETDLKIHPPLLEDAAKSLGTSKDAQLIVTVTDQNSGKVIVQDTNPIKLYSRFDMQWQSEDGTPYYENILAWVTPEAPEIDQMLRLSADSLSELTNGKLDSIIGYQEVDGLTHEQVTAYQVCAMMYTLAAKYNVKYIMAPFSSTSSDLQSIKTPSEVINGAGGLCVETAVTMASAIERTNMHAVIILLPGHAQVAVETWAGSGDYFLIETTALDSAAAKSFDKVVYVLTKDDWKKYLSQDGYVAIDCDLAEKLNIKSID